ncbi:MAG: hypothetical protein K2X48_16810 [Chitinophagaceae bacterium]|nr:hypothetical protein [Chitinophagaceae bacterium]
MNKSFTSHLQLLKLLSFLFLLQLLSFKGKAQFNEYNRTVRVLNYHLLHLEHLLFYTEQTTLFVKDVSEIYRKRDTNSFQQVNWKSYHTTDANLYRERLNAVNEALRKEYDVADFIKYNKKNSILPDSLSNQLNTWLKRADTIAISQNKTANELLTLIVQYSKMPEWGNKDVFRIHQFINTYHLQLQQLEQIRDSVTAASLQCYMQMRAAKKYPLSVYADAVDYLLQTTIYLNNYFIARNQENDEAGISALRKANENIQLYLQNEYIYRKNNDALPGHHVFPFNEEVHLDLSNSLKEIAFEISRYISDFGEKVDSAYFLKQMTRLIDMLNVVSFSHDENVDVRKQKDIPERYHTSIKQMLRYDFLMYRYDTYRNSRSNKNTAPMPLTWSRYVYTFPYKMPPPDSNMVSMPVTETKPPVESAEEKEAPSIQIIKVYSDSLNLYFYDNAEVDNDTITISVNGVVTSPGIRLDTEPYVLKLGFAKNEKAKEVVVSANNLGRIPPNTAYLKVTAGEIVYRLYLFTTKKKDAVVRIIHSKEVKIDE